MKGEGDERRTSRMSFEEGSFHAGFSCGEINRMEVNASAARLDFPQRHANTHVRDPCAQVGAAPIVLLNLPALGRGLVLWDALLPARGWGRISVEVHIEVRFRKKRTDGRTYIVLPVECLDKSVVHPPNEHGHLRVVGGGAEQGGDEAGAEVSTRIGSSRDVEKG